MTNLRVEEISCTGGGTQIDVTGAVEHTTHAQSLDGAVERTLNELFNEQVTMEEQFENVEHHLFSRHQEILEARNKVAEAVQTAEQSAFIPETVTDKYRSVLEAVDEYLDEMETAMDVLDSERNHAFGNEQNPT